MEHVSKLSYWCIFCLRNSANSSSPAWTDDGENVNRKHRRLEQFLKLVWRYTTGGGESANNKYDDFSKVLSSMSNEKEVQGDHEYGACQDCSLVLHDFCDFYEKVKVLEMKLDWKLQTLKSIVRSAEKVPQRLKRFQEKLEGKESRGKDVFLELKGFRKKFIRNTSRKLKSTVPRVQLTSCRKENPHFNDGERENKSNHCGSTSTEESTENTFASQAPLLCNIARQFKSESVDIHERTVINDKEEREEIRSDVDFKPSPLLRNLLLTDENTPPDTINHDNEDNRTLSPSKISDPEFKSTETLNLEQVTITEEFIAKYRDEKVETFEEESDDHNESISDLEDDFQIPVPEESTDGLAEKEKDTFGDDDPDNNMKQEIKVSTKSLFDEGEISVRNNNDDDDDTLNTILEEVIEQTDMDTVDILEEGQCENKELLDQIRNDNDATSSLRRSKRRCVVERKTIPNTEEESQPEEENPPTPRSPSPAYLPSASDSEEDHCQSPAPMDHHNHREKNINRLGNAATKSIRRRNSRNVKRKRFSVAKDDFSDIGLNDLQPEDEISLPPAPNGRVPSLKELALKRTLKVRYFCKFASCIFKGKFFLNHKDLLRHKSHHRNFRCNFCNTEVDYAPNLCAHEIQKHSERIDNEVGYKCPRFKCEFASPSFVAIKRHHLKVHLGLNPDRSTCSICKLKIPNQNSHGSSLGIWRRHYWVYHDLTNANHETVKRCGELNCRAFFRTIDQLNQHLVLIHGNQAAIPLYESRKRHLKIWNRHVLKSKIKVKSKANKVIIPNSVTSRRCKDKMAKINIRNKNRSKNSSWIRTLSLSRTALEKLKNPKVCRYWMCKDSFFQKDDLEVHSKLHGTFQCVSCKIEVNSAKVLFRHEMRNHGKNNLTGSSSSSSSSCPRCEYSASGGKKKTKKNLLVHYLKSHFELSLDYHTCPVCDKKIPNTPRLDQKNPLPLHSHLKRCHNFSATIYKCKEPNCEAYFNAELALLPHQHDHKMIVNPNPMSEKTFQCKDCNKGFRNRTSLMQHIKFSKAHSYHLPYQCPSDGCSLRFEDQEALDHHTNSSGLTVCPQCGKCYHGEQGLNNHIRLVHYTNPKEKKTYICEICGKDFKNGQYLQVHSLSHSGPDSWEFSCDICGKKIMTKQKLTVHMRSHSKEKPFICSICGVSYAHRFNLRIHINNKHSDVASDPPRKFVKERLVSRKGVKRGLSVLANVPQGQKSTGRGKRKRRRSPSPSSTDSNISD